MTGPPVPLPHLPGYLPDLVGNGGVLALVPVDPAATWTAETAWEVARQASLLGHRTLLVDCFVDAPQLHSAVGASGDDGIVDAFEYGASLNRIAQPQPGSELFFVPTGTFAADPAALLANPRWPRLAAGFRHEGALLVLFVPSASLPSIVGWTDAVIVLAPEGFDYGADAPGGLVEAEQAGKPLVVVTPGAPPALELPDVAPTFEGVNVELGSPFELVPDEPAEPTGRFSLQLPEESTWEPPPPPQAPSADAPLAGYAPTAFAPPSGGYAPTAYDLPPAPPPPPPPGAAGSEVEAEAGALPEPRPAEGEAPPAPPRRTRPPLAGLEALRPPVNTRRTLLRAGGFIVGVWLVMAALRPEWVLPIGRPEATPVVAPRRGDTQAADSLPWIVQVSAWNDLPRALEAVDTLAARGIPALLTPLRVGRSVAYRVQAGPFATMPEAEALLDTLRAASLADPDGSAAVALPLSFQLTTPSGTTPDLVRADRDSLRAAGVAAFVLAEPGGRLRLYAGAFEHAEQAQVLDSVLFTLRRARRFGTRIGTLP